LLFRFLKSLTKLEKTGNWYFDELLSVLTTMFHTYEDKHRVLVRQGYVKLFSFNCQIDHHYYSVSRSSVLKAPTVKSRSIPLIDPQSTSWSTLDWHLSGHLCQQSVESQAICHWVWIDTYELDDTLLTIKQLLLECWSTWWSSVNRVSIELSIKCRLRCRWSLDRKSIEGINRPLNVDAMIRFSKPNQYI